MGGTSLRYFFVYGPKQFAGMGYKSVIVKNFERIKEGKQPIVFGDGNQVLDYVFVEDVVEATLLAATSQISGEVFNVGSGVGTSINALTKLMLKVSESSQAPQYEPADWTAGTSRVGKIEKIGKMLNWNSKTSLEEGLRRTWTWINGR
jgi:UDP-glucose 4-epimerase